MVTKDINKYIRIAYKARDILNDKVRDCCERSINHTNTIDIDWNRFISNMYSGMHISNKNTSKDISWLRKQNNFNDSVDSFMCNDKFKANVNYFETRVNASKLHKEHKQLDVDGNDCTVSIFTFDIYSEDLKSRRSFSDLLSDSCYLSDNYFCRIEFVVVYNKEQTEIKYIYVCDNNYGNITYHNYGDFINNTYMPIDNVVSTAEDCFYYRYDLSNNTEKVNNENDIANTFYVSFLERKLNRFNNCICEYGNEVKKSKASVVDMQKKEADNYNLINIIKGVIGKEKFDLIKKVSTVCSAKGSNVSINDIVSLGKLFCSTNENKSNKREDGVIYFNGMPCNYPPYK
jgi:hypothetical protein